MLLSIYDHNKTAYIDNLPTQLDFISRNDEYVVVRFPGTFEKNRYDKPVIKVCKIRRTFATGALEVEEVISFQDWPSSSPIPA